jgi:hypothetical protein
VTRRVLLRNPTFTGTLLDIAWRCPLLQALPWEMFSLGHNRAVQSVSAAFDTRVDSFLSLWNRAACYSGRLVREGAILGAPSWQPHQPWHKEAPFLAVLSAFE